MFLVFLELFEEQGRRKGWSNKGFGQGGPLVFFFFCFFFFSFLLGRGGQLTSPNPSLFVCFWISVLFVLFWKVQGVCLFWGGSFWLVFSNPNLLCLDFRFLCLFLLVSWFCFLYKPKTSTFTVFMSGSCRNTFQFSSDDLPSKSLFVSFSSLHFPLNNPYLFLFNIPFSNPSCFSFFFVCSCFVLVASCFPFLKHTPFGPT